MKNQNLVYITFSIVHTKTTRIKKVQVIGFVPIGKRRVLEMLASLTLSPGEISIARNFDEHP
jgi:hypothetical protein